MNPRQRHQWRQIDSLDAEYFAISRQVTLSVKCRNRLLEIDQETTRIIRRGQQQSEEEFDAREKYIRDWIKEKERERMADADANANADADADAEIAEGTQGSEGKEGKENEGKEEEEDKNNNSKNRTKELQATLVRTSREESIHGPPRK